MRRQRRTRQMMDVEWETHHRTLVRADMRLPISILPPIRSITPNRHRHERRRAVESGKCRNKGQVILWLWVRCPPKSRVRRPSNKIFLIRMVWRRIRKQGRCHSRSNGESDSGFSCTPSRITEGISISAASEENSYRFFLPISTFPILLKQLQPEQTVGRALRMF